MISAEPPAIVQPAVVREFNECERDGLGGPAAQFDPWDPDWLREQFKRLKFIITIRGICADGKKHFFP